METSTLIVLMIAIFIIIYRIKTWNEVTILDKKLEEAKEKVAYKVETNTFNSNTTVKTKLVAHDKSKEETKILYKKKLHSNNIKNVILFQAFKNTIGDQLVFEIKSRPKAGVITLITVIEKYTTNNRAVGIVYECIKENVMIKKSFDVKMQANNQFKVSTSFSKAITIKISKMQKKTIKSTHLFVSSKNIFDIENVSLTLIDPPSK